MDNKMDDDGEEKDDSKRKSRNLSEKKRRDQFNALVNELNILISVNNKKMDKSSILKSTISFLRQHKEITNKSKSLDIKENWKPPFLSNEEFIHLILEALDGFVIIFSAKGNILYISESVTSLLGYLPKDVLSMTMYDISYEMDHDFIFNICNEKAIDENRNKDTSFYCHLKRRNIDNCERLSYELVRFVGYFRYDIELEHIIKKGNEVKNVAFIGIGRIQTPQLIKQMSIVNTSHNEFLSKHSLEWKFLYLDHRAPPIIGYLPFEVLGTSGYDYYHYDDLEKVLLSHKELIQKGEGQSVFYRFLTKGQQWIWLKTRSHIQYHQSMNPKAELVVCIHQVVCYADVIKNKNYIKSEANCSSYDYSKLRSLNNLNSKIRTTKHKKNKHYLRIAESDTESIKLHTQPNAQSIVHVMPTAEITSQIITTTTCQFPQSPSHYSIRTPQIVGHTFLEPQQYLAAIPVQPVIPTIPFATASSIIPTFSSSSEVLHGVVMTPAAIQLQRKHDELQKRIMSQQQELRRVSEQLIVAKNLHRFNIPVAYNTSKHQNNENSNVYNVSNMNNINDKYLEYDENRLQRYSNNLSHEENRVTNIDQFTYTNKNSNYGSDHEDRMSNMNSTVTSNDLEILPYQLSHEQSQVLFDTSNSSNDVNLNLKNCK